MSRHAPFFQKMREAALDGPGTLERDVRLRAMRGEPLPAGVEEWAERVRSRAATVEDGHAAAVLAAGLSEDQVFELTVCAALGAAERRLRAAQRVLGRE